MPDRYFIFKFRVLIENLYTELYKLINVSLYKCLIDILSSNSEYLFQKVLDVFKFVRGLKCLIVGT